MAWFEYGNLKGRKRQLRKGVYLRVSALPKDLIKIAETFMRPKELIEYVIVKEIRKDNCMLEFWTRHVGVDPMNRHTVFTYIAQENPEWICESDVGRGYKE